MEDNVIVKIQGDERFPEVINKLNLLGKAVRISYRWGTSVKYITGKIADVTPQFIFISRPDANPTKNTTYCIALREVIGFRQIFGNEASGGEKRD